MTTLEEQKKQAELERDRVELRSEKVRNMIGEMPPFLIRWGNTILIVVFVLLAMIAWFFNIMVSFICTAKIAF